MKVIDNVVNKFISSKTSLEETRNNSNNIELFYENQMWSNYKIDEKQVTEIIKKNVKPVDSNVSINLNIFYKIRKLKNIVIINNPHKPTCRFNAVYQYTCNKGECNSQTYIGYTEQTLEERFRQHRSVKKHMRETHNIARIKTNRLWNLLRFFIRVGASRNY